MGKNLKLVEAQERDEGAEKRREEEAGWKLDRAQVAARVHEIRLTLASYSERLAGVQFDIITQDTSPLARWP